MEFDIKRERVRRASAPALDHSRIRGCIKSRVHFDHFKVLGVPGQPRPRRHFFWIPMLDKTGVRPTRGPDKNLGGMTFWSRFEFHKRRDSLRPQRLGKRAVFAVAFAARCCILTIKTRGGAAW